MHNGDRDVRVVGDVEGHGPEQKPADSGGMVRKEAAPTRRRQGKSAAAWFTF